MSTKLQLKNIKEAVADLSDKYYGDHSLDAISGAGQISKPKLALVFINPTHRNISTSKSWGGIKAPWIGCANIWQLFADAGLIDQSLNELIQKTKIGWTEDFALQVYEHVAKKDLYITNIVKWAGLDAKLPEKEKLKLYAPLLIKELEDLGAEKVVLFGQLTFEAVLRELSIKPSGSFGSINESMLSGKKVFQIDSSIGAITPCYFPVGQGIKNKAKAVQILRLISQDGS